MVDYLLGAAAFLLGAFPSAYIFCRAFKGTDIRKVGSGNVGGMNTVKEAGPVPGILTILVDIAKGALAVYLALRLGSGEHMVLMAAFLAILGHNFNPFLGFNGGKGLATALGAFLMVSPLSALFVIGLMIVASLGLRDTGVGAALGVSLLPVVLWFQYGSYGWVLFGAAMALIIVVKHHKDFREYAGGRRKLT